MNKRIWGIGAVVIIFIAIVLLNRKEVKLQSQYGVQLRKLSASGYELATIADFDNPNLLSSTLTQLRETFYVNGRNAGIVTINLEQGIPGRKVTSLPVSIRIPAELLKDAISDSVVSKVVFDVEGEISYRNFTSQGVIQVQFRDSVQVLN